MTDLNQDSQKPAASEQSAPKQQQDADDFPHIPLVLQHGADEGGHVYRGSDKGGSSR